MPSFQYFFERRNGEFQCGASILYIKVLNDMYMSAFTLIKMYE